MYVNFYLSVNIRWSKCALAIPDSAPYSDNKQVLVNKLCTSHSLFKVHNI